MSEEKQAKTSSAEAVDGEFDFVQMMENARANLTMAMGLLSDIKNYIRNADETLSENPEPRKRLERTDTVHFSQPLETKPKPREIVVVRDLVPESGNLHEIVYWFDRKLMDETKSFFEITRYTDGTKTELETVEQELTLSWALSYYMRVRNTSEPIKLRLPDMKNFPETLMKSPFIEDHISDINRLNTKYTTASYQNPGDKDMRSYRQWTSAMITVYSTKTFPIVPTSVFDKVKIVGEYSIQEMEDLF